MLARKLLVWTVAPVYIAVRLAEEQLRTGVFWWPLTLRHLADPYRAYRKLRARDPVHRSLPARQFVVSRYADIDRVLRDHRNFGNDIHRAASRTFPLTTRPNLQSSILSLDPPDHTRLRALVNHAFTPHQVAKMEDYVRATAHALLDRVEGRDEFDLMKALAAPLPILVMARIIGVPEEDLGRFKVWSDRFARILEPFLTKRERELVLRTDREFGDYFEGIVEQRRREPRDDLVSRLVEAEEKEDELSAEEIKVMLRLLLVAGNQTTTNLIGNAARALLRHPEQLRLMRERPELAAGAVEELLRYDSPVQLNGRAVLHDTEIGGVRVNAGSLVILLLGSANRDPRKFQRPDELDITRPDVGHISFGRGIHHCLGAPLARLEGRIALEVLLERYEEIGFGTRPPKYRRSVVLRGLEHFDVRVRRRGNTRSERHGNRTLGARR